MNKFFIFLLFSLSAHLVSQDTSLTYEDFVNYQDPSFVLISPDGTQVAYGLNVCKLETNKQVQQIYLQQVSDHQDSPFLLELDTILSTEWQLDGEALWILGILNGSYCIYSCNPSYAKLIIQSDVPIQHFTVSSSGDFAVYSEVVYTPEDVAQERKDKGYVFEWGKDSILSMYKKSYIRS